MTFQQKYTNLRDIYLVKKWPKNLSIGNPPPIRAMPKSNRLFSADVFPKIVNANSIEVFFSTVSLGYCKLESKSNQRCAFIQQYWYDKHIAVESVKNCYYLVTTVIIDFDNVDCDDDANDVNRANHDDEDDANHANHDDDDDYDDDDANHDDEDDRGGSN